MLLSAKTGRVRETTPLRRLSHKFEEMKNRVIIHRLQINISIFVYPAILSRYPCPVIQNHIKKFCSLGNAQFEQKLRKLEVLKHLLWLLHVFIFDSFLASFLFLIIVKIIFMPAQKCPYIYSKDEGHKYRLLRKVFYFSRLNTLSLIRNAERHFYSPLMKFF